MVVRRQYREVAGARVELGRGCWIWCPGCDYQHRVTVVGEDGSQDSVVWEWDGNVETPTFSPSILVHAGERQPVCHSFIRAGRWEFLGDCTHALAGQTVDMVPLPDWLVRENN